MDSRVLTPGERNEARHLLQEAFEQARVLRNAMEPETGVFAVTVSSWTESWQQLTRSLDAFTEQVTRWPA